ncbi:LLM class F420-dependent oxidoreductase [Mycolicibacterium confluentis]|uniref:LLM class F420-dependent oxidoreductase n=1 Tax=Mycolicibacterium confluentis TaxID=28047 RepID=A0A7I7XS63_9MYCO|nr:LLM class F420-dependent oxidoreductase [Mycolicibacterium confluentis]MCV7318615.1 LLM class F420-dependent oxidoreductase [Mycolicibacterium confluentis]ORV33685.1 LLM class F420-dependent oxidoreductase [Mycolicibacterium confluentis]BBZ31762.1 LLM class F420-dependent oxidoreductase [Mycolicibacterium confluentis]
MPTGIFLSPLPNVANVVDDVIDQARRAYDLGVRQIWLAQQLDTDAITLAAVVGAAVPGLGVGTSVVPINPRHPLIVASLAQTAQAATHGHFSLGLGLGAHAIEQRTFGIDPAGTVARLREHLQVLRAVFDGDDVDVRGEHITAVPEWPVQVAGGHPVPLYVAAMGPKALQITGELADGTLPYLAGPRTIKDFIVPTITDAATKAGRPTPRVIAAAPVLVTDDRDAGLAAARAALSFYDTIPSYQKVVAREGLTSAADLAIVGSHDEVLEKLSAYRDAGASDVVISPLKRDNPVELEALWRVAAAL